MLCAKFQNDQTTEMDVMDKHDFTRFEFKMHFGGISYIAQYPRPLTYAFPCGDIIMYANCPQGVGKVTVISASEVSESPQLPL